MVPASLRVFTSIETEYSISRMLATIEALDLGDSGKFLQYDCTEPPS